ncbi:MAG TPA: UbiA family prenyltransferase [bacterium]|jgi:4-hydroxybenzoate polyprenyltransferase|nr:UbiA family prenyltransferase [bacterium]
MDWLRLARPKQWSKNLLLFAGLLFSGSYRDIPALVRAGDFRGAFLAPARALLGCLAFILLSASVYALNDRRDLEEDRLHPVKRGRPVAAGLVSPNEAALLALLWALLGLCLGACLGLPFFLLALAYLALSTLYSLWTKHQVILDVLSLAAGFVLRAAAGAAAVSVEISAWLLLCSTLLALFLGFVKRRSELVGLAPGSRAARVTLAHYSLPLLDQMIAVVASATLVAYSLYAFSAHPDMRGPWMMLTIPFVLYGILRYLYLAHQKGLGAAPEKVLLGDRPLQIDLALWVLCSAAIVALARP